MEVLIEELSNGDDDPHHLSLRASAIAPLRETSILDLALAAPEGARSRAAGVDRSKRLQRLDLLQQERAVLTMPEISIRDSSR